MKELHCPSCGKVFFRSTDLARTILRCPACASMVTFDKNTGAVLIKQEKYAREDPKYVRTYFDELKQHNVAFRTRMQWLSRIYGGRDGYTSEELYKIITGKTVGGYYIYPFVKGAPPEVNRILESTYRRHREAGDTKEASAIAAWNKVKQAGYTKVVKPSPSWVKKRSNTMIQMQKYGLARVAGKLVGATGAGLGKLGLRKPKLSKMTRVAGLLGVGYLTGKAAQRAQNRGYQLEAKHFTPDILPSTGEALREQLGKGKAMVARTVQAASGGAQAMLIALLAAKLFDALRKKAEPTLGPYLPDIRSDIELTSGYNMRTLERVVKYTGVMPTSALEMLRSKGVAALASTRRGLEHGMLLWLLGFISAELLARGITRPKSEQRIILPQLVQQQPHYAMPKWLGKRSLTAAVLAKLIGKRLEKAVVLEDLRASPWAKKRLGYTRIAETGERLPKRGFQPFNPRSAVDDLGPMPKWKRHRLRGAALITAGGLLGLALARRKQNEEEDYGFASATGKLWRAAKKTGASLGRGTSTLTTNVLVPAALISELWPRKKKKRPVPEPSTPPPVQPYALVPKVKGLLQQLLTQRKSVMATRHAREIGEAAAQVELTRTRMAAAARHKKLYQLTSGYSVQTVLQRRRLEKEVRGLEGQLKQRDEQAVERMLSSRFIGDPPHPYREPRYGPRNAELLRQLNEKHKMLQRLEKHKKLYQLVEIYPFRSEAQRRWMHATHPEMAEEWEEHTPKKKKLPEKVSKHTMHYGIPALGLIRALRNLGPAKMLKGETIAWARQLAVNARTAAEAAKPGEQFVVRGIPVEAKKFLSNIANNWETVADQVHDVIARSQLEKLGTVGIATIGGVAAREWGKRGERERVRRAVG